MGDLKVIFRHVKIVVSAAADGDQPKAQAVSSSATEGAGLLYVLIENCFYLLFYDTIPIGLSTTRTYFVVTYLELELKIILKRL